MRIPLKISVSVKLGRTAAMALCILVLVSCATQMHPAPALESLIGIVYFNSNRTGDNEIYCMNADGTGIVNLSRTPDYEDIMAAVSPDGSTIAFMRGKTFDFNTFEVWVMDADGNNQRQITSDSTADGHADFAPDSRRIVFASWRDGNEEIYIADTETGVCTRLTDNPASDNDPDWSPDGSTIAFKSTRAYSDGTDDEFLDPDYEIYTMDTLGMNLQRITNDSLSDHDPDFSPDGSRMAFLRVHEDMTNDVWIMNADGTEQMNLSNTGNNWYTSFNEAGTHIMFCSSRGENTDIYVMKADGTEQIRVTYGVFTDEFPAWSE